jgi:hypothetical protein
VIGVDLPPEEVIQYILYFKKALSEANVPEIQG